MKGAAAESGLLVIVGCGNPNRSDDGAGVAVIRTLREDFSAGLPPTVRLFDAGTGGFEVMFQARGAAELIVVDACRSGSEPGSIFLLPAEEIGTRPTPSFNLHDFRWDHAIYSGRRIFGAAFPEAVSAYLIEAGSLEFGLNLTPAVVAAADEVARRLALRVRSHAYCVRQA